MRNARSATAMASTSRKMAAAPGATWDSKSPSISARSSSIRATPKSSTSPLRDRSGAKVANADSTSRLMAVRRGRRFSPAQSSPASPTSRSTHAIPTFSSPQRGNGIATSLAISPVDQRADSIAPPMAARRGRPQAPFPLVRDASASRARRPNPTSSTQSPRLVRRVAAPSAPMMVARAGVVRATTRPSASTTPRSLLIPRTPIASTRWM